VRAVLVVTSLHDCRGHLVCQHGASPAWCVEQYLTSMACCWPLAAAVALLVAPVPMHDACSLLHSQHAVLLWLQVQAGVARTGKWWGHQHWPEMQPDMLIFAKGIASGYPMAGLAAREGLFDNLLPGTMGGTYGGNAVACAAAVATIDAIEQEGIMQNAADRGVEIMQGLVELAKKYPEIVDVRGRGLMIGVEFGGAGGRGSTPRKGLAGEVVKVAAQHDLLLMPSGARECIRILPPLVLTQQEAALAVDTLGKVLAKVLRN
jgi:4-aminobutyrate aminotransferase